MTYFNTLIFIASRLRPLELAEKRPNAVILSSAEGSRSQCFQDNARFFLRCAQDRLLAPQKDSFNQSICNPFCLHPLAFTLHPLPLYSLLMANDPNSVVVRVEGLHKRYGDLEALRGITFE